MLLRHQTTPAATATTLITPRSMASPETGQLPPVRAPGPHFYPNMQLLYLAAKHRISSSAITKTTRRKSESARITRRRRKASESDVTNTSLADGSEVDRCKTAESDFLLDGNIDDIDLSDEEIWSLDSDDKTPKDNKYQRAYLHTCRLSKVTPVGSFLKGIKDKRVTLTNYELGPKGVKPCCVALALNPPVEALSLKGNNIEPKGASYIAEMLSENMYITELSLADNRLGSEGARILAKVLVSNENIKKLDLSGNGFDEKDASYFADILRENQNLRELNLSHNCFREKGGELLGPSLVDNTNLETLDLSWNHLRRRGAVAICDGIKNNLGLKKVNLAWNGLYAEGCKALNRALVVNRTLTELDVSCNRIDRRCMDELLKGLCKNESILIFRAGENPLTTDGAVAILRMLEKKPSVPMKVLDLKGQCVDNTFITILEKIRKSRPLEVSHGNLLRKDDGGGNQGNTGYIEGDPMMVLMEFMRLQNLRLVDLFAVLDTDGSKTLTRKEFREGLMKVSIPVSPEGLDKLINKLDADGDGEVDYAELIQGQKDHKRKLARMMKRSKDENIIFEDTEIGMIQLQLKALIAFRDAAKKEAITKKRTGFAGAVSQCDEMEAIDLQRKQTSRPSSGSVPPDNSNPLSSASAPSFTSGGKLTSSSVVMRAPPELRPASTPLSKLTSGAGGPNMADRVRRAMTPAPGGSGTLASQSSLSSVSVGGATLGSGLGWTPVSGVSSAATSDTGTPPGRRSPNL